MAHDIIMTHPLIIGRAIQCLHYYADAKNVSFIRPKIASACFRIKGKIPCTLVGNLSRTNHSNILIIM